MVLQGNKMMRETGIIALILFASLRLSGQGFPTIDPDSTVKTSEFYSWTYDKQIKKDGHGGTYWHLGSDFKLYFGRTAHHPPSNHKDFVGTWRIQNDSIFLIISKPKKIGLPKPTRIKYRIFQITWTTNTGFKEEETGLPLILRSVGIILSDDPDFRPMEIVEKLNHYVQDNFQPSEVNEKESMSDWDNHDQIERLVRQYFNLEETIIGIKHYRNKNLWIR